MLKIKIQQQQLCRLFPCRPPRPPECRTFMLYTPIILPAMDRSLSQNFLSAMVFLYCPGNVKSQRQRGICSVRPSRLAACYEGNYQLPSSVVWPTNRHGSLSNDNSCTEISRSLVGPFDYKVTYMRRLRSRARVWPFRWLGAQARQGTLPS